MLGGGDGEKGKMSERKISSICHSYLAWMTGEIVVPSKKMEIGKKIGESMGWEMEMLVFENIIF